MADTITYQEVAAAIAAVLTKHPQFEKTFQEFEKYPWASGPKGLFKNNQSGGIVSAERHPGTGKIHFTFSSYADLEE